MTEDILLDVNKVHFILASAPEREVVQDLLSLLDKYRDIYPEISSNDELLKKYKTINKIKETDNKELETILPSNVVTTLKEYLENIK